MAPESDLDMSVVQALHILDSIHDPILVIDRLFHIVYMNRAAKDRYGIHDLKAKTHTCYATTHGHETPCHETGMVCPVRQVFATGAFARAIHLHKAPNGSLLPEEVLASPLMGEDGSVAYVVEQIRNALETLKSKEVIEHMRNELDLLHGLLPICASCKRIRRPDGGWDEIERYITDRSSAHFSHGICPDCASRLYPDHFIKTKKTTSE